MKEPAILIENLSKEYTLGRHGRKGKKFQALKNISLEVEQGKVMGLIGPNGAGKSTLLKILARITQPTTGRIVMRGRLASLLEVGTGFHPELTGRENIFLNGAILGMSKQEIHQVFDEIVDFSGVSQFLDTPVKRYSSGMYVRLAFSVAAHLNSDILLVDEVLAVGDAEFQKKCLAKMSEATHDENRTVIFVSHNMSIARTLCDQITYLDKGQIQKKGDATAISDFYLQSLDDDTQTDNLADRTDRKGTGEAFITDIKIYDLNTGRKNILITGEAVEIEVSFNSNSLKSLGDVNVLLHIFNSDGHFMGTLSNRLRGVGFQNMAATSTVKCRLPKLPLMAGNFFIKAHLEINRRKADIINHAALFEVLEGDYFNSNYWYKRRLPGVIMEQEWFK